MHARDHLLMAIKSNHRDAVARLIRQVDYKEEIENKKTPIQLARDLGHWDCVEAIASNKKTDAVDAARYGDVLLTAVKEDRLASTRILLEAGGASRSWFTPAEGDRYLHAAIRRQNLEMIVLLLSFDCDVKKENKAKQTPIQLARDLDDWNCVETIAKNKKTDAADTARYGDVLLTAVEKDRLASTRILLEAGASRIWHTTAEGDRCLHVAVRKRNAPMVALLLSFGFDLKKENTAKQTPLQLADSLKVSSIREGWKIYYDVTSLKMALPVVIQSMRQQKSAFYKVPYACCELIVSFLSQQAPELKETVRSSQNALAKISANCFLSTSPGIFRKHSSAYREFVTELKTVLQTSHEATNNIGSAVKTYLKKNKGKKTRTLSLLFKYKWVEVSQNNKEKKKEVVVHSKLWRK